MNRNSGRTWINFKELRAQLKADEVLRFYNIEPTRKGSQHQGRCPLPSHSVTNSINSFSVNLDQGIFQCFGCKAKGNILEFAALMEGVDPGDGSALRKVAVKLQGIFFPEGANTRTAGKARAKGNGISTPELRVAVNEPLDFELKGLDSGHPFLKGGRYNSQTIAYFGIGFCSRGFLAGRLAVPLHNPEGKLIGYAGQRVDEGNDDSEKPRLVFPERRERNGAVLEFDKSLFLYNGWRIKEPCDNLIIVQCWEAVWWLNQHSYTTAVAVMGEQCSERQIQLTLQLVNPFGWVWIMCDGNEAGDNLARSLLFHLSPSRLVRRVDCGKGKRPADLSAEQLEDCFQH